MPMNPTLRPTVSQLRLPVQNTPTPSVSFSTQQNQPSRIVVLNKKYDVYKSEYHHNQYAHKFFDRAFKDLTKEKSLENADTLWIIFQNNIFMLDNIERFYYTIDYIKYLTRIDNFRFKPAFYQIVMNIDYHIYIPMECKQEWMDFKHQLNF